MNELLWMTHPAYAILSLDELGIRDICFVAKESGSKPTGAPWYQHEKLYQNPDNNILITQNNFLVRNIAIHPQCRVKYLWDCPRQPDISREQWYRYESPVLGTESPFYMRHVNVDGNLNGLTVSCYMWTNMSFHAHGNLTSSSKPSPAEVEWIYSDQLVWVYFPISPGEKICGVWVLTLPGGLATVAIYTTLGRSRIFGSYQESEHRSDIKLQRLNGSPDGYVKSIYYNDLRPKPTERDLRLAVVSTKETTVAVPEDPPWPIGKVPVAGRQIGQDWFHSQAILKNVQSIDTCKHRTTGICLGILLHYEDSTREALGQWRFDHNIEVMDKQEVPHQINLCLGYVESIPCVTDICFGSGVDDPRWVAIAMRGCLVWWFSKLGGLVVHEDDTL
ncbi:GTPase-activating protein that regulates ARFs (ADP-ribosylation factors) [Pyrenophora tritici-repentis]|nr:GTPase-activating protein that regulates ARFs (ADP-ribosylation factors) [Pyrenophora tritici-repentis]